MTVLFCLGIVDVLTKLRPVTCTPRHESSYFDWMDLSDPDTNQNQRQAREEQVENFDWGINFLPLRLSACFELIFHFGTSVALTA